MWQDLLLKSKAEMGDSVLQLLVLMPLVVAWSPFLVAAIVILRRGVANVETAGVAIDETRLFGVERVSSDPERRVLLNLDSIEASSRSTQYEYQVRRTYKSRVRVVARILPRKVTCPNSADRPS